MNHSALIHIHEFVAGSLFGGQLVWTLAVVPSYRHLSPKEFGRLHSLLTWYGDLLMPIMGISATMLGFIRYRETGQWNAGVGALALTVASVFASRNLAINVRLRDGDIGAATDEELLTARRHWAVQHWVRTLGGAVSFVLALMIPSSVTSFARPGSWHVGIVDAVIAVVLFKSGSEVVGHIGMMLDPQRRARLGQPADIPTPAGAATGTPTGSSAGRFTGKEV